MKQIMIIAMKEITDGLRNRWILMVTALMAGLALLLALLGSAPTGATSIDQMAVVIVSLASLSIFFVPLIALLLSYDSIVADDDRGTLLLLVTYPVARWHIVAGKFIGQLILLAAAITIGYLVAGFTVREGEHWGAFLHLIGSSILLGAVFLALGLMISSWSKERGTAAGLAIVLWVLFVLVYDLGLIGLLTSSMGENLNQNLVSALLLANPTDIYRMYNLTGSSDAAVLSGMAGVSGNSLSAPWLLMSLMMLWIAVPLSLAFILLGRRQI